MITVIDKDGTEVVIHEGGTHQITLPRRGIHDLDVACYRNREWFLLPMSYLQVGDFFRVMNRPTIDPEQLMLVTSRPKVVPHLPRPEGYRQPDPDISVGGVSLSCIREAYQRLGSPLLSSVGLPFSPNLLRLL